MRITGPGGGVPPPPIDDATTGATKPGSAAGKAESFARQLDEAAPAAGAGASAAPAGPAGAAQVQTPSGVQSVIDDLRAGRINADQAVERLVDETVSRGVGRAAPEAVRQRLRVALADLVAADPHLRDLVGRMERKLT
ncbi:MAG TPA: hypothetical protein VGQ83_37505 [Polyangia bacterium]|jgi:hypothetical protein